jgi:flagellin FlaB
MLSYLLSLLQLSIGLAGRLHASERGQTGTEIALVGVVCATCVLGGVVIATSDEAADQLESVFHAGLQQASGTLVVSGSVLVTASGEPASVDQIVFTLDTIGQPAPVALDSAADERLLVAFSSDSAFDNDVPFTAVELRGDGDGLLEPGEMAEFKLNVADIDDGNLAIGPLDSWTLRVSAPSGGVIEVSRTMPLTLQAVNSLR